MNFVTLSQKEFDAFAKKHPNRCYLQTSAVANLRKKNGWDSYYLGVKEKDTLLAATLLLSKKRHFKQEFYAIRGPLLDFKNEKLTSFFLQELQNFCKKNKGLFLRIDPYQEAQSLDKDGKETGEFDHRSIKEMLQKLGFQEVNTNTVQAKYMYVIDLKDNLEDVMKEMDSKTRQMIRKNEKNGIVIRKGTEKDIPLFEQIMEHTSERRQFENRGQTFYENFYKTLKEDNLASLVFAELDIEKAKKAIQQEKEKIKEAKENRSLLRSLGKCNAEKAKLKEEEEERILEKLKDKTEKLNALEKKHGKKITLGAILYVLYEGEMASVFGGSYEEFKEYQPFYTIHYEMIQEAIEKKCHRYNFYAIHNPLDQKDSQYGIYQFKRGFGGHVVEFLGEFILPIDKLQYKLYQAKQNMKK